MAKKPNIFNKEVPCGVCHGEKYLECCSVDGTECEKIICPNCGGTGLVPGDRNSFWLAVAVLVVIIVFLIMVFL